MKFNYLEQQFTIFPLLTRKSNIIRFYIACCLVVFSFHLNAQSNHESVLDKVVPLGDEYQNSIELLDNRFRIDSDVKEVTIVFFREYGTAPIVLVRPDGSKLYLDNDTEDNDFDWFETDTYDMIALRNPMPGPWQAVGNILPESRVMVIAGITLNAKPLPKVVFSGETIKQEAYLENEGKKVDMSPFREAISLSVDFVSTNNPTFPNFGLGSRSIANFKDNGLAYDEYEADGMFTGHYNLDVTEGEWKPVFTVRTPLFSREQVTENITLLPNPVMISHQLSDSAELPHILSVDVERKYVDISSVLIDGTIRYPSGEFRKFSLTEPSAFTREIPLDATDYGMFKISMKVFAKTLEGRDLVLNAPDYSFVTEMPVSPTEVLENEIDESVEVSIEDSKMDLTLIETEDSQAPFPLALAISINLGLLIVGVLIVLFLADRRNNPSNHFFIRLKARRLAKKQTKLAAQS